MEDNTKICSLRIDIGNTSSFIAQTGKDTLGLKNAKQRRGNSWKICDGKHVHVNCCARYVNFKTIK